MAYVTRCPYCGAVWLLPNQETAEAAPVKCSKCLKCFDATRDLLCVPDALFPQQHPATQVTIPEKMPGTAAPENAMPSESTFLQTPPIQAPVHAPVTVQAATPEEPSLAPQEVPLPAPPRHAQKELEKLSILMSDFSGRTEPTVGIPSCSETAPKGSSQGEAKESESEKNVPQTVGTAPKRKKNTWVGPVITGALLLVILAVGAIVFNQMILQKFPSSKSLFESVCTKITCPGFFLKNIEAFAVTKAQLTSSGTPGNYTLEVTILNGSTIAQAVPHLSLQLVDDNDAEITRQVLTPADFLADPSVKSLGAGRSLTVRINMRTNATPSRCIATPIYP